MHTPRYRVGSHSLAYTQHGQEHACGTPPDWLGCHH